MPDTTKTKVEYIETNSSTNDAADKFWEIEVTKADGQQEAGVHFTNNTYGYLRLGTVEHNTVYNDVSSFDRAVGDSTDVRTKFDELTKALTAQSSAINSGLDAERKAIGDRKDELAKKVTALTADLQSISEDDDETPPATVAAKQAEKAYFEAAVASLEEDLGKLPKNTAKLIEELTKLKNEGNDTKLETALAGAAGLAGKARRQSSTTDEKDRGDDLAAMVTDFYDDYRYRGVKGEAQCTISEAEREDESKRIHTKGGWRDHTNGNRISTTRGDKVEVIRGNYSLLVLGRQDEPGSGAKWESGGGHFARDNDTQTPGAVFEIRWVQDPWGGTWRCIEETTKGDVISRYQGNVEEVFYGDIIKSTTGHPSNGATIPGDGARRSGHTHPTDDPWISSTSGVEKKKNPEIIEKTWASKIESYTGSSACRLPSIYEETWASKTESKTDVLGTVTDTTTVVGAVTDTTTVVGAVTNTNTVAGQQTTTDIIVNQVDITLNAAANTSVTLAPIKTDFGLHAAQFAFDISAIKVDFNAVGVLADIALGILKLDLAMTPFTFEVHGGTVFKLTQAVEVKRKTAGIKSVGFEFESSDIWVKV